jgi:nucleotide-binding universal stress UspA family protein
MRKNWQREVFLMRKILVPTDGSDFARRGLEKALEYAQKFPSEITLLNVQLQMEETVSLGPWATASVGDIEQARKDGEKILQAEAEIAKKHVADIKTAIAFGNPADQIVKFAEENAIDLIVIGSEGLSGIKRFLLGSVANRVVAHAHCSVLVIKMPQS